MHRHFVTIRWKKFQVKFSFNEKTKTKSFFFSSCLVLTKTQIKVIITIVIIISFIMLIIAIFRFRSVFSRLFETISFSSCRSACRHGDQMSFRTEILRQDNELSSRRGSVGVSWNWLIVLLATAVKKKRKRIVIEWMCRSIYSRRQKRKKTKKKKKKARRHRSLPVFFSSLFNCVETTLTSRTFTRVFLLPNRRFQSVFFKLSQ